MAGRIMPSYGIIATALVGLASATVPGASSSAPNVLFILADDLGYNELNYRNNTRGIMTPNIDALAQQGVRLATYYVNPICSPTRSALHTGRYTHKLGTQSNVIYWNTPWGISLNETFLPQYLKGVGYNTAMYGKWHLGMHKDEYLPNRRGYDDVHGYLQGCESAYTHVASCCTADSEFDPNKDTYVCPGPANGGCDYRGYDWFVNGSPDASVNKTKSVFIVRDLAKEFLEKQASQPDPFFLYLPFQNIHGPYIADDVSMYSPDKFSEGDRILYAYITELDAAIGAVVDQLKATGQFNNTIIIFSSDNGAPPYVNTSIGEGRISRNWPLRGWKTEIWEGGTRVPGFISSPLLPSHVQNTDYNSLFHVTDWVPTIVEGIAGGQVADGLDGYNHWSTIISGDTDGPRTDMVYGLSSVCDKKGQVSAQAGKPSAGIRSGKWKLLAYCIEIKDVYNGTAYGRETRIVTNPGDHEFGAGAALFDLEADPGETTNVAATNPDIVTELTEKLIAQADASVNPMVWVAPYQGPDYECANCSLHPCGKDPNQPWSPWL